jgi:hypothetical protein
MKFRKKPAIIQATQWFKNGDHPDDNCPPVVASNGLPFQSEGKIVRYYRHPDDPGTRLCNHCTKTMHEHGWIDNSMLVEGGHTICPGDWIITGNKGEHYPIKDHIFQETYEAFGNEDQIY